MYVPHKAVVNCDALCSTFSDALRFVHLDIHTFYKYYNRIVAGIGSTGAHWSMEQTSSLAESLGVSRDGVSPWCWWIAVNMMYSDYYGVASHFGVATPEFFAELARAFLLDEDGPGPKPKMSAYYCGIVKGKG